MDFKHFLSVKKSCLNCPFLKENGIAIGEERLAEIKQSLLDDDMTPFQCHKTTHPTGGYHTVRASITLQEKRSIALAPWDSCTHRGA